MFRVATPGAVSVSKNVACCLKHHVQRHNRIFYRLLGARGGFLPASDGGAPAPIGLTRSLRQARRSSSSSIEERVSRLLRSGLFLALPKDGRHGRGEQRSIQCTLIWNDCWYPAALICLRVSVERKCRSPGPPHCPKAPRRTSASMIAQDVTMNCDLLFGVQSRKI